MRNPTAYQRTIVLIAGLTLLLCTAGVFIYRTLSITVDLGYFLPNADSVSQEILIDNLGQGPGSRLIFATWESTGTSAKERIEAELRATGLFTPMPFDAEAIGADFIPKALWQNRYLLTDVDLSEAGLRTAFEDRLADVAIILDPEFATLAASDPHLASISKLQTFAGNTAFSASGNNEITGANTLVIESRAPAFDAARQHTAISAVRETIFRATNRQPELFGAGVYTAELQHVVRQDATIRSALASFMVIFVLLVFYRRASVILISLMPVVSGGIAGILALSMIFGEIHGITLAFGFTLLGVAIDYPLHYLSHHRHGAPITAIREIWPTLKLSATTTIIAYTAISFGGSKGLAQLGIFSATGVITALCVTRWILPQLGTVLVSTSRVPADGTPQLNYYHSPWILMSLVALVAIFMYPNSWWQPDLSALVPVDSERLKRDQQLRRDLGAPDMRYLIAVQSQSREGALEATENLTPTLNKARDNGIIDGYLLVTELLPSQKAQQRRLKTLIDADDLATRAQSAQKTLPFRVSAFEPFVRDVQLARINYTPITDATWRGSPFEEFTQFGLYEASGEWITQSLIYGLNDPTKLSGILEICDDVTLIDLRNASIELVRNYRQRTLTLAGIGLIIVFAFLAARIGIGNRLLWITGCVATSLVITVTLRLWSFGGLSLFSVIACVLVAGLSIDYGLFYSNGDRGDRSTNDSSHAVSACAISTSLAFLILALSPIPVLRDIGLTVSIGIGTTYILLLLSRRDAQARTPEHPRP